MKFSTASISVIISAVVADAAYTVLQESYTPANFFSKFDFYTGADPTNGFVKYIDQASAQSQGIIKTNTDNVYVGVDYTNSAPNGRNSVRLESKARFQRGLIVLDLAHMPGSICGTWPAFWTLGDNWPNNGEIDIIEGVNLNTQNAMALHTSDGCSINGSGQSGTLISNNCYVYAANQSTNQGCGIQDTRTSSYGTGFNNIGGGVYATEWNSDFIKIWFFPRNAIPANVLSTTPEPTGWGTPVAVFQGSCDINSKFISHKIIFDITFCGDWAGNVWGSSGCPTSMTCNDYVANTPAAFTQTYWQINSLKVYSS
ncbi:uncharacterized protein LAJ45_03774 [Morchella importuna]|uniref:endo-1,3(4)-beta-glucanase n=1 Tax=Morchella conica CCBAS932 TaxID=1392247 RepID=A0A3N4KY83_9PEZI|nr:uncharacterized protein LAJ45_03774 [Morchella importuna]KAH8152347.1 hypothetical protein LAJ45_03774 [Morchella importuna]RPB14418.1 putative endo-1,3(4)-beta-glucanase [Morchella conica CCBAS932]